MRAGQKWSCELVPRDQVSGSRTGSRLRCAVATRAFPHVVALQALRAMRDLAHSSPVSSDDSSVSAPDASYGAGVVELRNCFGSILFSSSSEKNSSSASLSAFCAAA